MYHKVPVTIEVEQFKKLIKGRPTQLKAHQLHPNHKHHVMVHKETAKRINRAKLAGKGVRLEMSPHEIEMTGEGWGDLWNSIKSGVSSAWNWGRENVPRLYNEYIKPAIESDFYQTKVRPKIREKLEDLAESKPYAGYTVPAIEWTGDQTGAWGLKEKKTKGGKIIQERRKKITGSSFKN